MWTCSCLPVSLSHLDHKALQSSSHLAWPSQYPWLLRIVWFGLLPWWLSEAMRWTISVAFWDQPLDLALSFCRRCFFPPVSLPSQTLDNLVWNSPPSPPKGAQRAALLEEFGGTFCLYISGLFLSSSWGLIPVPKGYSSPNYIGKLRVSWWAWGHPPKSCLILQDYAPAPAFRLPDLNSTPCACQQPGWCLSSRPENLFLKVKSSWPLTSSIGYIPCSLKGKLPVTVCWCLFGHEAGAGPTLYPVYQQESLWLKVHCWTVIIKIAIFENVCWRAGHPVCRPLCTKAPCGGRTHWLLLASSQATVQPAPYTAHSLTCVQQES